MTERLKIKDGIVISNPKCPPGDRHCYHILYCCCLKAGVSVIPDSGGGTTGPLCKRIKLEDLDPDLVIEVVNNGKSLKMTPKSGKV